MCFEQPALICLRCGQAIKLQPSGPWVDRNLICDACGWRPDRQDGFALLAPELAALGSDYDPAGFARLSAAEPWHFWFAPRARLLGQLIQRHFPVAKAFLEVGCGTGYVTGVVAGLRSWERLMGAEVSADGLAHAARLLPRHVELVQMDARALPFRGAFDVIGCFDVLEHITEDREVLAGFARGLKPGGGVVLSVPQHMWLWSNADVQAQHKRRYARGELEEKCRAAGLEVVSSVSFASLTLPIMMASRIIPRRGMVSDGGTDEMRPPAWINASLRFLLQCEVTLSLGDVRWPLGGSRVVTARKPPG